jgi:DEAD/DEAH box helicase domain-containing protein
LDLFVAQLKSNAEDWHEPVLNALPSQAQTWNVQSDNDNPQCSAWQLLSYLAPEDRKSLTTLKPRIHVLLALNDSLAQKPTTEGFSAAQSLTAKSKSYKDKWRAIWQAFNVLQYAPSFSVATQSGLQAGLFSELLVERAESSTEDMPAAVMDSAWLDVRELSCLSAEQVQAVQAITTSAPEVGVDLLNSDGVTIGTAELAWQHLTVAVFMEEIDQLPELQGWQCISLQSDSWLEQLRKALGEE